MESKRILEIISHAIQEINASLNLDTVMDLIYKNIKEVMDISFFIISSYDEKNMLVTIEYCIKQGKLVKEDFTTSINNSTSLSAWTIRNNCEIIINDLERDYSKYLSGVPKLHGKEDLWCESVIMIPLLVKNKLIGLFSVQNQVKNSYSESDIDLLRLMSTLISTALNNSKIYKDLEEARKRSDELLLNILPAEVADELKAKGSAKAKQFDNVTVMFTDFKDFTQISEKLTPSELVAEIHFCFKAFDEIITRHNIEKIKTIGDSYMCAGGLPVVNNTNAIDVVNAALEIQLFIHEHLQQRKKENKEPFEIRIGVHTGPLVAGIVGVKKFAYDIWGDTVNIASRMESSGEIGKINISGSTYELVKHKFNCVYRGKCKAKNKGEIDMYFVDNFIV